MSLRWAGGAGTCLLAEKALEDRPGRAVGHKVAFISAEEATWRATIHLMAGRAVEWRLLAVILGDMAGGNGRRLLSGCRGCCGWSGDSGRRWGHGFVGGDLFIGFFEVFLEDPDLVLHGVD